MADDARLSGLLLQWEELQEQGREVSVEELCRDAPELLDEVRRCVKALKEMKPALEVSGADPTIPAGSSPYTSSPHTIGTAAQTPPVPAFAIPGYEILGELGRGGMGVVYKARQLRLGRIVALKMIMAGVHASAKQRLRFQAEAEAAARLQHAHIVQVYEIGEQDGCPYISLEYIEGRNLYELLRAELPTPGKAAALTEQLARAVFFAHQRGIVHRDLKPGNILLTVEGVAKITDFGLAKRLDDDGPHTRTGDVLGTPSYMAPEQAAGKSKEVGPATDIYALGAILYEMLTGRPPFEGTSTWDTVSLVLTAEPEPPAHRQPDVPRDLETICLKCLQKDPAKRYTDAHALAEDLCRFQNGEPIKARPVGRLERSIKWARRRPAVAALLATSGALLLALLIGGWATAVSLSERNRSLLEVNEINLRALIRLNVTSGSHHVEDEDLIGSLVWYARALKLEDKDERQTVHRTRLATVLRQCPRLGQLWFHEDTVNGVAFSPDGDWIVTCSDDRTARVWSARTGEPRYPPLQHDHAVVRARFSPDGGRILTASFDHKARIWEAGSGKLIATLTGHQGPVNDARFSPNGAWVITASADASARIWNAADGTSVAKPLMHDGEVVRASFDRRGQRALTASRDGTARIWSISAGAAALQAQIKHDGAVNDATFSPDGYRIATAGADNVARIWSASTGEPLGAPLRHQAEVLRVVFRSDGRRVATASADLTGQIWDSASGRAVTPALRHYSTVYSVSFSPDGTRIATASDDNSTRIWDANTGRPLLPPLPHNGAVTEVRFSPDGQRLATASQDTTARCFDLEPEQAPTLKHRGAVLQVSFSPDGSQLLTAGADRKAHLWDLATGKERASLQGHTGAIGTARFSPDGSRILTAGADGKVCIWNAKDNKLDVTLPAHAGPIRRAEFSPDGKRVVTASYDTNAQVWNAVQGASIAVLGTRKDRRNEILDVAFSPDGRYVATGGSDRSARLWHSDTGREMGEALRHQREVVRVAFSADGTRLATASFDRTGQLWDLANGQALWPAPLQHAGPLRDIVFSPDGSSLATCSDDNTVRIWSALSGALLVPPLRHYGTVITVKFSADGKRLASASADNTARVWDVSTGEPLTPPLSHRGSGQIEDIAFNPSGDRVVTAGEDGTARIWSLDTNDWSSDDWERIAELLGGSRISADGGGLIPLDASTLKQHWAQLPPYYFSAGDRSNNPRE